MDSYQLGWEQQNVEVDVCSSCGGIWLDAHEGGLLRKIVNEYESDKGEAHEPTTRQYFFMLFTGLPIEIFNPTRRKPVFYVVDLGHHTDRVSSAILKRTHLRP